ncbi:MAG: mannose-6-phosphate isomerase, class I [Brevibacillus sp.]|nr:mannose-6-phosphate isomerase, class I [Brevibacillus sp.]
MKPYPLLFTPTYHQRIWGGDRLRALFGYSIPSDDTGEAWVISDHPKGRSTVSNGAYRGKTIQDLLQMHPEWFARERMERFPLLVKLLDANDDLSVQVHPDDAFAAEHENGELGKAECWYIVHAEPGAQIVYGHSAKTREELQQMIAAGCWDQLLQRIPVKTGDFFFIPHGTIHALGRGIVVLETQQNSDATYRAYDYDRVDSTGKKRELHLDKVLQVTSVPSARAEAQAKTCFEQNLRITQYQTGPFFTVQKWWLCGTHEERSRQEGFTLFSVLSGTARLRWAEGDMEIRKGDHLLLPRNLGRFILEGELDAIVSWPPAKQAALQQAS